MVIAQQPCGDRACLVRLELVCDRNVPYGRWGRSKGNIIYVVHQRDVVVKDKHLIKLCQFECTHFAEGEAMV